MSTLEWSPALALDCEAMDATHREFVELLAVVQGCAEDERAGAWQRLLSHTVAHFAQEDAWMRGAGFAAQNCHSGQHEVVLQVMREVQRLAAGGRPELIGQMAGELALWFAQHAQQMDAALAAHLRSIGWDGSSAAPPNPQRLPAQEIRGCGGASCSPQPHPQPAAT